MTFVEMHVKSSVTLTDRLGPEFLTVLEIKGQVLHRVRLHGKVAGWLSNLRAVLCKNRTKGQMKNFQHPTQIYMEVGPHEGCSKMSIIEVITQLLPW